MKEDIIRSLVELLAIPDKEEAAGKCGPRSEAIRDMLHREGYRAARVVHGTIRPSTGPDEWAFLTRKTWEQHYGKAFVTRSWVELEGYIIDGTAAQFGEPSLVIVSTANPRYTPNPA